MKSLTGMTRQQRRGLIYKMTPWSLRIVADEMVHDPRQVVRIIKRFLRIYRAGNLMNRWTKPMKFSVDERSHSKLSVYVPHWPSQALETRVRRALRHDFVPPEQVTLAITDRCPYKCRHCSNVRSETRPLPLNRLIDLIKEIQDLGGSWLNIGGGEPSVEFDRALATVQAADARSEIWLNTTGFALDADKIKQLRDAGLFGGRLSVHHCDPEAHDEFVGYRGAFGLAAEAMRTFRDQEMFTVLSAAIPESSMTQERIGDYVTLGHNLGACFVEIIPIRPAGRAVVQCSRAELKRQSVSGDIFKKLNDDPALLEYPAVNSPAYLEQPDRFGCVAGSERLYISASGDVQPCPLANLAMGNVIDEPLADIWARMHSLIPGPRSERLCSQLGPILARHVDEAGGDLSVLPLPPEKSRQILAELPECQTPKVWAI